jgi:hypothetical protein
MPNQAPNPNDQIGQRFWELGFIWALDIGIWDFSYYLLKTKIIVE